MFCGNCGAEMKEGTAFCGNCGARMENAGVPPERFDMSEKPKKQYGVVKVFAVILVLCIAIGVCKKSKLFDSDIRGVKNGNLFSYDYGITIGDALHTWFDGDEEWTSYEKGGYTYVEAYGYSPYGLAGEEWQKFVFKMDEVDDRFSFTGAYDGAERYIWSSGSNMYDDWSIGLLNEIYSYAGVENATYELAIRAAFGDAESLDAVRKICAKQNNDI